jgi:hypothetical protein
VITGKKLWSIELWGVGCELGSFLATTNPSGGVVAEVESNESPKIYL